MRILYIFNLYTQPCPNLEAFLSLSYHCRGTALLLQELAVFGLECPLLIGVRVIVRDNHWRRQDWKIHSR